MQSLKKLSVWLCVISLVVAPAGCGKRQEGPVSVFAEQEGEFVVTVITDLSGSCAQIMAEDGAAFRFTMTILEKYFRSRIGTHDRLIVGQISNSDKFLLWEGEPLALRKQYGSASAFAQFLRQHADDSGSRVYTGVTRALQYTMSRHTGKTKRSATFVLSDMLDYSDSSKADAQAMLKTVAEYCQAGGSIGFFYVDQNVSQHLQRHLAELGVENFRVETDIVSSPQLPNLD